jgi:two-component system cell cycle sensor histidine kinase/response regulator CckA
VPFFTTIGARQGHGAAPGRGTTVKIYLPSAEGQAADAAEQAPAAAMRGSETILVLEDEARVPGAGSGEEGIRMAAEHPGGIDLPLTDVVMPEMSGPQVLEQMRARYPHMRVLLCRAIRTKPWCIMEFRIRARRFCKRPFLPEALARKAREVLASQASAG